MKDKIQKIINFIEFLYENNLQTKWFTMHGTSLYLYTQQINLLTNKFKFGEIFKKDELLNKINLILNENTKNIKDEVGPRNSQRLTYWEYLNIFEKIGKNTYKYVYDQNINYFNNNYFINRGIYLIHNNQNPSPLKAIFNGFSIYLIYKTVGKDEFNNIVQNIKSDAAFKILESLKIKKSGEKQIDNSTFHDLYKNFFSNFSTYNLMEFIDNVKNEIYNLNDNSNINNNNDNNEDILDMIKDILDVEDLKTYDMSLEKMITKIRSEFSNNFQSLDNDILIDDISNYDLSLFENAHIFPVSEIKKEIKKYKNGLITIEQLEKFLILTINVNNGFKIPFNYHKLFDNNLIKIDWECGKFVFSSDLDENKKQNLIKIFGFNINNKFKEQRFKDIKKNYEEILKLIRDF